MIANTIKTARIKSGLSQKKLADKCGINVSQVRRIEYGDTKKPHLFTLKLLAENLNLDVKDLNKEAGYTLASLENYGSLIKNARINANLSQTDLANLCGISTSYLFYIESGKSKPHIELLPVLSEYLNLNLEDLTEKIAYDSL